MVDLRPLVLINALAVMLFVTAGFAHVRNPDAMDVQALPALTDITPPSFSLFQDFTTTELPAVSDAVTELDDLSAAEAPVFADETDDQTAAMAASPATEHPGSDANDEPAPSVAVTSPDPASPNTAEESALLLASLDAGKVTPLSTKATDAQPSALPAIDLNAATSVPPMGELVIRSNVYDDRVRINGEDYGSTRLNLDLAPGKYVIEVTKPGYQGWTQTVDLGRDRQLVVFAKLEELTTVEYRNGSWRHGIVSGQGSYEAGDGTRYEGGFLDREFHGQGKLVRPDGTSYEGEWVAGKKEGYGILVLANGDQYRGQFRADQFNGDGTLTKNNGDIYTGLWVDGKLNGEGTLTTREGLMYVGSFVDNEFAGAGNITYPDGTHYEGGFSKSLFHGKGILTYNDGKKYDGQFIEGQYHGKGELLNPNGSKISGTFKFGKPYGQATLTTPAGEVFTARSTEPGVCYRVKSYRATQCPSLEGW